MAVAQVADGGEVFEGCVDGAAAESRVALNFVGGACTLPYCRGDG